MKNFDQNVRVAISTDNPSIARDEKRCIKCGECARVCSKVESVNCSYNLANVKSPICVNCGQCIKVCPTGAMYGKEEYKLVQAEINKKGKIVVVSTSPAVRVALGDEFGLKRGSFVQGKMVALLKKLGFDFVLDTSFSADLTICEEATELVSRINSHQNLPQFTSCCPAWVKYAETFFPELLDNLSTCKSPIAMQGALVKTYFANAKNIDPEDIVNVVLTPCVAKKFEIKRQEFSNVHNEKVLYDTDYCITTTELAKWAKEQNIDFVNLQDQQFDVLMSEASGGGIIFGNSGGVMESAVRTAYYYLTHQHPPVLNFKQVRGVKGVKEAEIEILGNKLKLACVSGLANAKNLIAKIKSGEKYDFVEVMACPGGCVGGGGQPKHMGDETNTIKARINSLYEQDFNLPCKTSYSNSEIEQLYANYLGNPNGEMSHKLLHTKYQDRSSTLCDENSPNTKTTNILNKLLNSETDLSVKLLNKYKNMAIKEGLNDVSTILEQFISDEIRHQNAIKKKLDKAIKNTKA